MRTLLAFSFFFHPSCLPSPSPSNGNRKWESILRRWWDCSILRGVTFNFARTAAEREVLCHKRGRDHFLFFVFLPTVSVWLCVRTYSTRAPLFCFFPVWVFQECVSVLASVGGKKKKRSLHWFLKSLIKGWQIFLSSCVVLKQTAGLLFPRPPPPPSVFLLPPLPPSLIPDYWGGCGGALFFTGAFVAGILHSCCARRNPDPK